MTHSVGRRRARIRRVCMVVHGPYPIGEPRVAREARSLVRAGFEVDVVALRREIEPARETIEGVSVYRLPIRHRRGGGALSAVREYFGFAIFATVAVALLGIRRRYALVQVHNPPDFLAVAALVPRLMGARFAFDVHDLATDMFAMRFGDRRPLMERTLEFIEWAVLAASDAVITVHEPYRRELLARGASPAKTVVVMNAVDESALPPVPDHPSGDHLRIVYHGTVTPSYGVELLASAAVRASESVEDLHLEIYGEGDAVTEVRRLLAPLLEDGRAVLETQYLPHGEVLRRIVGGSAGVVPNLPSRLNRFALSSKLFEYVALGIPAIVADLPTLREYFSDEEVLFYEAGSEDALLDALLCTAADPEKSRLRARAARRRYEGYRWPVSEARYLAMVQRLCGAASRN